MSKKIKTVAAETEVAATTPSVAAPKVRTIVSVGEVEYRSVAAAFKALELPMLKHVAVRSALKASADGRHVFEHDGAQIEFLVVTPSEADPDGDGAAEE